MGNKYANAALNLHQKALHDFKKRLCVQYTAKQNKFLLQSDDYYKEIPFSV